MTEKSQTTHHMIGLRTYLKPAIFFFFFAFHCITHILDCLKSHITCYFAAVSVVVVCVNVGLR